MDAHCLKEKFFAVLRSSTEQAEERLSEWEAYCRDKFT